MLTHFATLRRATRRWRPRSIIAQAVIGAMLLATLVVLQSTAVFNASAATSSTGTSPDGRITITDTASPATVPYGGATVTYTYAVTNNTSQDLFYRSISDDKCSPITPSTGLQTGFFAWDKYIPAGGTATFTCTMTVTQTTTDTVTVTFADWYNTFSSTASAATTVSLQQPSGGNTCDTLWYSSDDNPKYPGTPATLGTLTTSGTATPKFTINMTDNGAQMNGAAAIAVNPKDPNQVYFTPRRLYNDLLGYPKETDGGLWVYDASTGQAKEVVTPANNTMAVVRLGFAPDGTLWTVDNSGVLWSYTTGATTWTKHGQITLPTGSPTWNNLSSGDLAFDGLGNMWLILSDDGNNGTANLFTITAAELAGTDGAKANFVGQMGTTRFNGIAFANDGTLYATSTSYYNVSPYTDTYLYTVNKDTGGSTQVAQIASNSPNYPGMGDMSSCTLPKPQLRVTKQVSPAQAVVSGTKMTYTITVENIGTLSGTGVTLQDTIPVGSTYVAGSAKLNGTQINTSSTFPYAAKTELHSSGALAGVIAAGGKATLSFDVNVTSTSNKVCNQGSVTMTGTDVVVTDDPNLAGSADATCVDIAKPAIAVDKTADITSLSGSGPVTYTYTVTNAGTEPLKTVTLADDKCPNPALKAANYNAGTGDINGDGILQLNEKWVYSCTQTLSTTTTNTATAGGVGTLTGSPTSATDTWTVTVDAATLNVVKKPGAVTGPNAAGQYTVTYTVSVVNTGNGAGSYGPLTDTPSFDPRTTSIVSASWTGTSTGSATGAGPYTLLPGSRTLAGGATETYTVSIVFTHPAGSGATSACTGPGTGLYNAVSATGETGSTSDNNACVTPPLYSGLSGTVYTDVNDNGSYNPSGDTPIPGATMTLKDAAGNVLGTTTTAADGTYSFTSLTPGTYTVGYTSPSGYVVTQTYQVTNPAGIPSTTGSYSSGDVGTTAGQITTGVDFGIYQPTQPVHVRKFGTGGASLAGATFALYDVDPGTTGAAPIANGITADAGGATFTTAKLQLGKTYWLVETKAPAGYQLLPDPVAFTVSSTGVALAAPTAGVVKATTDSFTLDVTDSHTSTLPMAGGLGADSGVPLGALGLVILALAAGLDRRRRGLAAAASQD